MRILTIEDKEYLSSILLHKDVLPTIIDDYCVEDLHPHIAETILNMAGCFCIEPEEGIVFMLTMRTITVMEVHMIVLPEARGIKAVEAAHKGVQWLFDNSSCEKIMGQVPTYNKKAMIFAKKVGFTKQGTLKKSIRKNNQLHDQIIFGLEKEEFVCHQQ